MRRHVHPGPLDSYLVGPYAETILKDKKARPMKNSRFLSLHLRFEIDMVAHSLCNFGGGEEERRELEAYREIHFPALVQLKKTTRWEECFPFLVLFSFLWNLFCADPHNRSLLLQKYDLPENNSVKQC